MKSEITADYLLVGGELDPDWVTSVLGLQPRKLWRVGEQRGVSPLLRHTNYGWALGSGLSRSSDFEEHASALFEQLEPVWQAAVDLCRRFEAELSYAVYSYGGDRPAIHLEGEFMRRAAELNAALDVDLYLYPDDDEDAP